jgi:predicted cupin superfamily sugar epimerase
MLNVLIVYAVNEEKVDVSMPGCRFHYCKTGVGKVGAAIAVQSSILKYHPDVVVNIGTAGSVQFNVGSIHMCNVFVDRDMDKLKAFGVPSVEDFSSDIESIPFFNNWQFDSICNTGDSFLTKAEGRGDVFDMESFAVARVCRYHQIPFVAVKYVTDKIGENSIKHWEDKLAEAQAALQSFMDLRPLSIPDTFLSSKIQKLIDTYQLKSHSEGGWYKEVFRSNLTVECRHPQEPSTFMRSALTSIYYLLANNQVSVFHRLKSPEAWYFHKGMPLLINVLSPQGELFSIELSDEPEGVLQTTIEEGCWFAAGMKDQNGFALVSCAVAPGFDFDDFEIANRNSLIDSYPQYRDVIIEFTR